ncbi:MAG: fibronectin type III domain-containing protein, partial [Microthrixaceae bacterium]
MNRISGDEYDGIYQATVSVPAGTSAGYWDLSVYPIRDVADNSTGFITRPGVLVGAPTAPTAVTAIAATGRQVTVSWQAPSDNGGNIITSYQLTESHTDTTRTVTGTTWTGGFPDIAADEPLTFTVAAVNAAGSSAASAPSPAITVPAEAPSPVRNASAVRGNQSAAVDWDAPAHTHGAPVTGYTVTAGPGEQQVSVEPGVTQTTVPGLTNGVAYTFTITAANTAGTSEGVTAGPVTPAGLPQTVASVTATASDRSAAIVWEPADGNGAPVTGHKVTATPGGQHVTVGPDATQATVPGLTNGVAYAFVVTATNSVGSSAPSAPSASVTPAGAPLAVPGVRVARGDRKLTVTWSAANGNGAPVTGYRVAYNDS